MANLYGLIVLLGLFMSPALFAADADYPAKITYTNGATDADGAWRIYARGADSGCVAYSDSGAMYSKNCALLSKIEYPGATDFSYKLTTVKTVTSNCVTNCSQSTDYYGTARIGFSQSCPSGGTLDATNHVCKAPPPCDVGKVRDPTSGQCVEACNSKSGTSGPAASSWTTTATTNTGALPTSFCYNGCVVGITSGSSFQLRDSSGKAIGAGWGNPSGGNVGSSYTGSKCSGGSLNMVANSSGNASPNDNPLKCGESGGSWGQVNGINTCVPQPPSSDPAKPNTPVTGAKTGTTTKDNGDGTLTKTDVTEAYTCDSSGCVKTTTTTTRVVDGQTGDVKKDASGNPLTTTTTTKSDKMDSGSFCDQNPKVDVCKKTAADSSFSGTCDAPPVCTGDPVQCATAKATWQTNCALAGQSDGTTLADKVVSGQDPQAGNFPWSEGKVEAHDMQNAIDQTDSIGGSCPSDLNFSVSGRSVVVPMSASCQWLTWIGRLMLAASMLTAMYIVFGRAA